MSDEIEQLAETGEELSEVVTLPHHDLMDLFEELSFTEKVRKIMDGLKQPKESGPYKYARLQMLRLLAPISAVVVPLLAILALVLLAAAGPLAGREVQITVVDPIPPEKLEDIEELFEEPPEPPEPVEIDDFIPDVVAPGLSEMESPNVGPDSDFSPKPAAFDSVALTKSPVIMKGIYGSRSPGKRGTALGKYGGGGHTEGAVMRALRWLKKNQQEDGSWPGGGQTAMTSLALLTFLAHGETPASEEFGETVEKGIRWLVSKSGTGEDGHFDGAYDPGISTYALCEAYGMTKVPTIKYAAERNIRFIINGQNSVGSFNYGCKGERSDLSVAGWCYQAIKAAKMAGVEVEGLDKAMKKSVDGLKAHSNGTGFGYGLNSCSGLTGTGVLCMQLMGAGKDPLVRNGLAYLEPWTFAFEGGTGNLYYWYYVTQAKFHAGGDTWKNWNGMFSRELVSKQIITKKAIKDAQGNLVDIGHWEPGEAAVGPSGGPVMTVSLCALQLQVYYRYLPTFKPPEDIDWGVEADIAGAGEEDLVDVDL